MQRALSVPVLLSTWSLGAHWRRTGAPRLPAGGRITFEAAVEAVDQVSVLRWHDFSKHRAAGQGRGEGRSSLPTNGQGCLSALPPSSAAQQHNSAYRCERTSRPAARGALVACGCRPCGEQRKAQQGDSVAGHGPGAAGHRQALRAQPRAALRQRGAGGKSAAQLARGQPRQGAIWHAASQARGQEGAQYASLSLSPPPPHPTPTHPHHARP